jgi:hypothetical protein
VTRVGLEVLLVDDDPRFRGLLADRIESHAEATAVRTAADADEPSGEATGRAVAPETAAIALLALPAVAIGLRTLAAFALSLDSIGTGLLVSVGLVYLVGAALLGFVLGLL